jgi:hypothetical protein
MDAAELLRQLASAWDLPALSDVEVDEILSFAAEVAHLSERKAAPLACWMAGRSGRSLSEAEALVAQISAVLSQD